MSRLIERSVLLIFRKTIDLRAGDIRGWHVVSVAEVLLGVLVYRMMSRRVRMCTLGIEIG